MSARPTADRSRACCAVVSIAVRTSARLSGSARNSRTNPPLTAVNRPHPTVSANQTETGTGRRVLLGYGLSRPPQLFPCGPHAAAVPGNSAWANRFPSSDSKL